jgi:bacillithiol biosynthesis cysteine-adding enzyme BshC
MTYTNAYLPYHQTNSFSSLVLDYIDGAETVQPFYHLFPTKENIEKAIAEKILEKTDRAVLVEVLKDAYTGLPLSDAINKNLNALLLPNTFTVCTAHQPNIFTGHLYFVYKILHTIKLADTLNKMHPAYQFVPVFFMGSEDADLAELGHINYKAEKINWVTNQKGAVGKMVIDEAFLKLIQKLEGTFGNTAYGPEIMQLIKEAYRKGRTIQESTMQLVNSLFGQYGLLVLIADDARLKKQMIPVFKAEILDQTSHAIVEATSGQLAKQYKEQAFSREINLFYFVNDTRERIEKNAAGKYIVLNTKIEFTKEEMLKEIDDHPEHFSPNVILRGLFQETILPNIVFIGGGGELAYWLQLKNLFAQYKIFYPILLLRNSFTMQTKKQQDDFATLGFSTADIFAPKLLLENKYAVQHSRHVLHTDTEKESIIALYKTIAEKASAIDPTLSKHIDALKTKQINKLTALDKKLLRAEKRNFKEGMDRIAKLKNQLFPNAVLQERADNIIPYYAKYGSTIFDMILDCSLDMESKFCVITVAE